MADLFRVVRWQRRGRRFTRFHIPVDVPADDRGATACGLRYPRAHAEAGDIADGELCRNCLRAMRGTQPERAEEVA